MNSSHHEIFHLDAGNDIRYNTVTDAEVVTVVDGIKCISGSYKPELIIFRPEVKANGLSIIICPGGGYEKLAIEHEGTEVAQSLIKLGITVFVLKYRLPGEVREADDMPLPLKDFITAYKTVQEKASAWGMNPSLVGIMGFSAGGHLASLASSILSSPKKQEGLQNLFPPRFTILIYPVISFQDDITHIGSRERFIGNNARGDDIRRYSSNNTVTQSSPPTFLVHCSDDLIVSVENSLLYYKACLNHNVSVEMHVYAKGGHGFGMYNDFINEKWMDRLANWLVQFF
ncbi:alpha/beta hydrolase [Lacibacter sp. H407]|uniref:alpha/beta hydrolase n=1 Tax=Lacibacter sp. H407 TaxID=3133423 RepID=UPI0030BEE46D